MPSVDAALAPALPTASRRLLPPSAAAKAAPTTMDAFIRLCGGARWSSRLAELVGHNQDNSWQARAALNRHVLELALARLANSAPPARALPAATAGLARLVERHAAALAGEAVRLAHSLPGPARVRLRDRLGAGLTGEATLIPLFHLLRTAASLRARGYSLRFTGLVEETPHDLVIQRDGVEAEVACDCVSAEAGRQLNRGDWFTLMDAINPELQTWLAAHPGCYLLKVTLPDGLAGPDQTAVLQARISALLAAEKRQDSSAQAMLKLDPLMLAGAQIASQGLPERLRAAFGPEAQLAVIANAGSVFVMAARAGRENEIADAVARRVVLAAETRLSGERPGILAMFIDDLDQGEWRGLRDSLELEGAVRRCLTKSAARPVVAVSCATRFEMLGAAAPDAVAEGELRFRNPAHPAAKLAALAPAVLSSM